MDLPCVVSWTICGFNAGMAFVTYKIFKKASLSWDEAIRISALASIRLDDAIRIRDEISKQSKEEKWK